MPPIAAPASQMAAQFFMPAPSLLGLNAVCRIHTLSPRHTIKPLR
jgi:hypothetical protein